MRLLKCVGTMKAPFCQKNMFFKIAFIFSFSVASFDVLGRKLIARPVWWHAPFFSGTGYATEAVTYVSGLQNFFAPNRLMITNHGNEPKLEVLQKMDRDIRKGLLQKLRLGFSEWAFSDRTAIIICHSWPGTWSAPEPFVGYTGTHCPQYPIDEAAYVIGRTMWETDHLPPDVVKRCNNMHEIWVPCEHNKEIFRKSGVDRPHIELIPGPVDTETFNPSNYMPLPLPVGDRVFGKEAWGCNKNRPFVFLSIFAWQDRKGWDVQLRAFLEEFGPQNGVARPHPEVALILVTHAYSPTEDSDYVGRMRKWAELAGIVADAADMEEVEALPQVYVTDEHISDHNLARLYKAVDAFVLSTRGEGYGRPFMEAMSMGLPVIATNWSGPVDFIDETVGYPLAVEGLIPVPTLQGQFSRGRQQMWAQPSVEHLRHLMREITERPQEAARRGRAARSRMLERYSPGVVTQTVAARLRAINEQLIRGTQHVAGV